MSFASDTGYTPITIETMMLSVMDNINIQFNTTYTPETFVGTNFYKYFYAAIQRLQENEVKTSEIFLNLQSYFRITNEKISRPVVTSPGLIEVLEANDFLASVKPMIDADAGKISICIDKAVDTGFWEDSVDYLTDKLAAATIIKDSSVAGAVTQGTEVEAIVLSNGQSFDFKYNLPNRIPVHLRLTLTLSENNMVAIGDPDDVKLALLNNVLARYRLGKNFEPQRYFTTSDAPWASIVLLEWSDDDEVNYYDIVFDADYDDLFAFDLARIHLVEV
jgi:hypothetical protein